jgi:hypothetical protein
MSGIANNPDTERSACQLERAYSVSAILKEIEALNTRIITYLLRLFFVTRCSPFRFARRFFDYRSLSAESSANRAPKIAARLSQR